MTLNELTAFRRMQTEINDLEFKLKELEAKAELLSSPKWDNVSHSEGYVTSRLELITENKIATELKLEARRDRQERVRRKIQAYINAMNDDTLKKAFNVYFLNCGTWTKAAEVIGGLTADCIKRRCYRYIHAHKDF